MGGGDGATVEEAHLVAYGAVALVEADGLDGGFHDWREFQTDLVLNVAAMAGAMVHIGRHVGCA